MADLAVATRSDALGHDLGSRDDKGLKRAANM
jgi:hypothetical protein